MIALLMGLGLGKRVAQLVGFVIVPLLILGAFYLVLDAYGDSRFSAGETSADDRWEEASRRLQEQAARSRGSADKAASDRADAQMDKLKVEKERIDAAMAAGGSPLDVLFGSDGGSVRAEADRNRDRDPAGAH